MNTVTEKDTAKRQVAKHSLLDTSGAVHEEDFDKSFGTRYQDIASGAVVDYLYGKNADKDRMLAIFGARTLMTNEASAVRNGKDEGGPAEQVAAINDRFALLDTGTWADRTREGGPKIDRPTLATCVVEGLVKVGKVADTDEAKGAAYAKILQAFEEDPKRASGAYEVPEVRAAYKAKQGKATTTLDSLGELAGL